MRETSIRRGVEVLLSLGSEEALTTGGLGVTQISELLGREKSQVSRALKALSEYGLVERTATASYRLGWRLYALAQRAGERRLLDAAPAVMRQTARALGERIHLSVLHGAEVLTLLSESPPARTVQAVGWTGRTTPAYCTSAGRALLMDWDRAEIVSAFAHVDFLALGPNTIKSPETLADAVERARAAGYAVADEEFEPGLIGAAAPVRDLDGTIIAALNVSAPRHRFVERIDAAGKTLSNACVQLTESFQDPSSAVAVTTAAELPSG